MLYDELLLGRAVMMPEARRAVARALGVPAVAVGTIVGAAERDGVRLQLTCLEGDFPTLLSIFILDADLARRHSDVSARERVRDRIAAGLNCSCLISDDGLDITAMLLVHPDGTREPVDLDEQALDDGRYVVRPGRSPLAQAI